MNIFIDGTWNKPKDNTNVFRLYEKYHGYYFPGPGTGAFFMEKWLGGIFGLGTSAIANAAYKKVKLLLGANPSAPIHIIGYSRGATASRKLAAMLAEEDIIVHFLGCFDTVGALGIPVNILGIPFQKIDLFTDMHVHENVLRAAHAMALDEKREAFQNTPMEDREGITQRGFAGDHGYVGSSPETFDWMVEQFEA